ncbi:hypothetical protein [Williamsia muralis]|uniref:Transmembrane protein n=1 Tax=Williamsia marianensis TaxID=85044 RepID=A0A2G3PJL0_WILMA|nr:hypothetical protein [Williamsia marianensis]PHV65292.1 hypothetical protein CSW57_15970 [Williamsia marianensis]
MARGSDPDSRPISVAELLARAKEQDAENAATGSQPAATPPTGRRHRGGKGAVSVAELTGEIPRVNDSSPPPSRVDNPVPPPTRDFNSADVSKRAQDTDDAAAPTPGEPERPALSRPRDVEAPADEQRADESPEGSNTESATSGDETAAMPASDRGEREESQTASEEAQQSDEETTGVIASVQAYSQVDDNDPDRTREDGQHDFRTAAEREADFQRYRNFEDVDDSPAAPKPAKRKRGLFGFGRKADEPAPAPSEPERSDDNAGGNTDHQVTQLIPTVDDSGHPPAKPDVSTRSMPTADGSNQAEPEQTAPQPATSQPATTATSGAAAGRYLRFDVDDDEQTQVSGPDLTKRDVQQPDPREVDLTGTDPVASGMPSGLREVGATEEHGPLIHPQVHPSAEETEAVKARLTGSSTDTQAGGTDARSTHDDSSAQTADSESRHSPTVQWLILIGQVLAGLAVGVALFWGFTELWRWNVYFALVLAVAVIFGMVTLVHVVRRSQDLISTLLALGVGLLVTIGPLVLLLVAGD